MILLKIRQELVVPGLHGTESHFTTSSFHAMGILEEQSYQPRKICKMLAKEYSYLGLTTMWLNHTMSRSPTSIHAQVHCMTTSELPNHPESTFVGLDFLVAE